MDDMILAKVLELEGMITKRSTYLDVINVEVNAAMKELKQNKRLLEDQRIHDRFYADRYFELIEDLVKYGFIQKEWGSE